MRNVGAEDGLRDKEAYQGQSITKSRVTDALRAEGESFVVLRPWTPSPSSLSRGTGALKVKRSSEILFLVTVCAITPPIRDSCVFFFFPLVRPTHKPP